MDRAEALAAIAARLEAVQEKISIYARHWAARYNGPVYLVGSTLHSPTPRDIDIRVVVPDNEFAARYGHTLKAKESPYPDRPELVLGHVVDWDAEGPTQRWIDDVAKLGAAVSGRLRHNVDLQVWPESHWRTPYPAPIRLAAPSERWMFVPEKGESWPTWP